MVLLIILTLMILAYCFCFVYCYHKAKNAYTYTNNDATNPGIKINHDLDTNSININWKGKTFIFLYSLVRTMIFFTGIIPSHSIRNWLYKHVFRVRLAKTAVIYCNAEIRAPWNLIIDNGAVIGDKCILDARSGLYIGKNVNISTGCWIWTLQHDVNSPYFSVEGEGKPVVVKDRAWLSCRTIVLPGTVIGEGSILSAGAVCTKSCEPYGIYGGIPAKKIGERNTDLEYEFDGTRLMFL